MPETHNSMGFYFGRVLIFLNLDAKLWVPNDYRSSQAHKSTIVAFPQRSILKCIESMEGWAD
jgi:hypothetical protein